MALKKRKGFTLIELIAVMAILSIVSTILIYFLLNQNKLFYSVNKETILHDEARMLLTSLENDIQIGKNKFYGTTSNVASVTVDGKTYPLPIIDGESDARVIYAFTKGSKTVSGVTFSPAYAYVLYGKKIYLLKENDARNKIEIGTCITENVDTITISPSTSCTINLVLKSGSEEVKFNSTVTPRNF